MGCGVLEAHRCEPPEQQADLVFSGTWSIQSGAEDDQGMLDDFRLLRKMVDSGKKKWVWLAVTRCGTVLTDRWIDERKKSQRYS